MNMQMLWVVWINVPVDIRSDRAWPSPRFRLFSMMVSLPP